MVTGHAIRAALSIGLHIGNEDSSVSKSAADTRHRLWWALWLLERQLVMLTGKPTAINDSVCTVPYPESQYLNLRVKLAKSTQNAIDMLHSPSPVPKTWDHIRKTIEMLGKEHQQWRDTVPSDLDFDQLDANQQRRAARTLGFYYYMSTVLVTRHCLSGLDQHMPQTDFSSAGAELCIKAARKVVNLLPKSIDSIELYKYGPWYNQVNLIIQACAVLRFEMSRDPSSIPHLKSDMERLSGWLSETAKHNVAALRASPTPQQSDDVLDFSRRPVKVDSESGQNNPFPGNITFSEPQEFMSILEQAPSWLSTTPPEFQQLGSQAPFFMYADTSMANSGAMASPGVGFEESFSANEPFALDPSLLDYFDSQQLTATGPQTDGMMRESNWDAFGEAE